MSHSVEVPKKPTELVRDGPLGAGRKSDDDLSSEAIEHSILRDGTWKSVEQMTNVEIHTELQTLGLMPALRRLIEKFKQPS